MEVDAFWDLIENSWISTDGAAWRRTAWLKDSLRRLAPEEIVVFQSLVNGMIRQVDTWDVLAAHNLITGGCGGGDSYIYFLHWIVGQPRPFYERIVASADYLADSPWIQALFGRWGEWADHEYPDWEGLLSVAAAAYAAVTGTEFGEEPDVRTITGSLADPDTQGDQWDLGDPEELARRLPKLYQLAGPTFQVWPPRR